MNDQFQPLAPHPAKIRSSNQPLRLSLLPSTTATPLHPHAPHVSAPSTPASPAPAAFQLLASTVPSHSPAAAPAPTSSADPQLSIERDGDRITRLTLRCRCGQLLELVCTP